jgi:hypothetical protein
MELAAPRHGRIPARSGKRPTRHRRPTGDSRHDHPDAPARRRGHPWPLVAAPGMTATSMLGLGECHNSTARSARNFHSPLRVPKTLHRAKSGIQSHLRSSTEPRLLGGSATWRCGRRSGIMPRQSSTVGIREDWDVGRADTHEMIEGVHPGSGGLRCQVRRTSGPPVPVESGPPWVENTGDVLRRKRLLHVLSG